MMMMGRQTPGLVSEDTWRRGVAIDPTIVVTLLQRQHPVVSMIMMMMIMSWDSGGGGDYRNWYHYS